jgi:hypothetical protein
MRPRRQHTFGLIAFGIALHELGWRITYLGADTPIPMVTKPPPPSSRA